MNEFILQREREIGRKPIWNPYPCFVLTALFMIQWSQVSHPIRWEEDNSIVGNNGSFAGWHSSRPYKSQGYDCIRINMPTADWYDHDCQTKYPGMCSIPIKVTRPCAPGNDVRWQKDGNDNCCNVGGRGLCKLGEGDCDKNSDCEGSLVCGDDNCPWGEGDDCCMRKGMHRRTAQGWHNPFYHS